MAEFRDPTSIGSLNSMRNPVRKPIPVDPFAGETLMIFGPGGGGLELVWKEKLKSEPISTPALLFADLATLTV